MSSRVEWRVSWLMWPHHLTEPSSGERITDDEESARSQYEGLLGMLTDHPLRPCDHHVWDVRLERRVTHDEPWGPASEAGSS
jgi:hypothetical protein